MTPDQRNKLATALIDQAFTCHEKGHQEDAESLMKQSVKVRFHDEIEKIIKGDFDGRLCLDVFVHLQHIEDSSRCHRKSSHLYTYS